jgi:hypothetical protein
MDPALRTSCHESRSCRPESRAADVG